MLKERVLTCNKMKATDNSKKRNVGFSCPENSRSKEETLTGKIVKYKRSRANEKVLLSLRSCHLSASIVLCSPEEGLKCSCVTELSRSSS